MPLSEQRKQQIIDALAECGALRPCPRCGNTTWTLVDGYFLNTIQTEFQNLIIGGPGIPLIGVVCNHCGYLSQHALGALGLLPENQQKPGDEQ